MKGSERMAKKKEAVALQSGVNLDGLSLEQLQALQCEIIRKTETVLGDKRQSDLSELKQAGRLQEFKATAKEFQKEMNRLAKGGQFEIVLPIRFSMKGHPCINVANQLAQVFDGGYIYEEFDFNDFIEFEFTAKLAANASEMNVTKNQHEILSETVRSYADDACEDILELMPSTMKAEIDGFMKRFNSFQAEVGKFGLTTKDLGL